MPSQRGALVAGAAWFAALGAFALLVLPERKHPLLSGGAAVAVAFSVLGAALVRAIVTAGRWMERVRTAGLECGFCHELLIGGPSGQRARATLETGMCSACGNRVFREEG